MFPKSSELLFFAPEKKKKNNKQKTGALTASRSPPSVLEESPTPTFRPQLVELGSHGDRSPWPHLRRLFSGSRLLSLLVFLVFILFPLASPRMTFAQSLGVCAPPSKPLGFPGARLPHRPPPRQAGVSREPRPPPPPSRLHAGARSTWNAALSSSIFFFLAGSFLCGLTAPSEDFLI